MRKFAKAIVITVATVVPVLTAAPGTLGAVKWCLRIF